MYVRRFQLFRLICSVSFHTNKQQIALTTFYKNLTKHPTAENLTRNEELEANIKHLLFYTDRRF